MGSVMSEVKCPTCEYDHAMNDYYYKSGEEYVICGRCGLYLAFEIVKDRKRTREVCEKLPQLILNKDLQMIRTLLGYREDAELSEDYLLNEAKNFIKRAKKARYAIFYKKTKNGGWRFRETKVGGTGATSYRVRDSGIGHGGHCANLDAWKKFVDANRNLLECCTHTEKRGGEWFLINDLTGEARPFDETGERVL